MGQTKIFRNPQTLFKKKIWTNWKLFSLKSKNLDLLKDTANEEASLGLGVHVDKTFLLKDLNRE